MFQNLMYQQDGAIAIVQLHRPEKKNSLNAALRREMKTLLQELAQNKTTRVIIITGGEDVFCAGADVAEIGSEINKDASAEASYHRAREFQILFDQVESLPQPVIAAIAGYAFGGGCELALACDFRIASESAVLGLPEAKIGAYPAGGGTQRLPRLIGAAKAKEMILTGDPVDAQRAFSLGLVTKVVPKGKLLEEARTYASKLASLPRLALETSKMLINRGMEMELSSAIELEARCMCNVGTSHDFREGMLAFVEKRKPNFTGN